MDKQIKTRQDCKLECNEDTEWQDKHIENKQDFFVYIKYKHAKKFITKLQSLFHCMSIDVNMNHTDICINISELVRKYENININNVFPKEIYQYTIDYE